MDFVHTYIFVDKKSPPEEKGGDEVP